MKKDYLTKRNKKKKYTSPAITLFYIKLEEGISTSSAMLTGPSTNDGPQIVDWEQKEDEQFWDF